VRCPTCEQLVRAPRPPDVPPGAFGLRLTSLIGLLNGRYRLSKREVVSLLAEAYGVEVSLGSVVRATEAVSAALAPVYAELAAVVAGSAQAHEGLEVKGGMGFAEESREEEQKEEAQ
jgi:transposase